MSNATLDPNGQTSKPKSKFRKWHFQLVGSQVAIAAFVMYLALFTSWEALVAGLCSLATVTMMIAFAAFFKAHAAN
jgi:hypothetical protein